MNIALNLNFSWLFIYLIVVLCLLIFPKWLDFPKWKACSKWKGLQYLECLTLYKLSPKVGRLLASEYQVGFWRDRLDQKTQGLSGRLWLIPVLPHFKADEISLLLFRFPGTVRVFINQLTTELKASTCWSLNFCYREGFLKTIALTFLHV